MAVGLGSLLTVVFVALKLTHVIDWSWWCVVLPTLIEIALGLVLSIIMAMCYWKGD